MKTLIASCVLAIVATLQTAWSASSQVQAQSGTAAGSVSVIGGFGGGGGTGENQQMRYEVMSVSNSRNSVPPLVIQFSPAPPEFLDHRTEDLAVMTRIFEKALDRGLGEEEVPIKLGVRMLLTGSGRSVRAAHIEGLGPLFMVKVNFPLVAPPDGEQKPPPAPARSEWDKARAEVKGLAPARDAGWAVQVTERPGYSKEQVEGLTQTLLAALKQATHIRDLNPEEFISVSVFGSAGAGEDNSGTVLTLRAKKTDVDAFAKGDLDLAAFRERASLNTYAGAGHDVTSVNSWIQESSPPSRNVSHYGVSGPRK